MNNKEELNIEEVMNDSRNSNDPGLIRTAKTVQKSIEKGYNVDSVIHFMKNKLISLNIK